jgi:hypothetical protein
MEDRETFHLLFALLFSYGSKFLVRPGVSAILVPDGTVDRPKSSSTLPTRLSLLTFRGMFLTIL